jgi:putative transposase
LVDVAKPLSIRQQCGLLGVTRSVFYENAKTRVLPEDDRALMKLLDECYTAHPFYGSRKMVIWLWDKHQQQVNRKRVRRLMRLMGLAAIAPGPNTSKKHPDHKIYPYLLRGVEVTKPNQVWSTDITYIRMERGFMYLTAVIDWYSRCVLSWRISNSMDTNFCVECLEEAIERYGTPEIFNSDQGSQFTSKAFTDVLIRHEVKISMDGKGRALDNIFVERLWRTVKYEDIYLKSYVSVADLYTGLTNYFQFYNSARPHQSLGYATPASVYLAAKGGGASIADKFSTSNAGSEKNPLGQRHPAAGELAIS